MTDSTFFVPSLSQAAAGSESVFTYPTVRFSLLTSRLVRIEISPSGRFEDRPSQVFWYRRQPLPDGAVIRQSPERLALETSAFKLDYTADGSPTRSLRVLLKETGVEIALDQPNPGLLPGTARTLDETNGPVRLQPGLVSRGGWVQLDDTSSLVFNPDGWLEPRPAEPGYRDLYLLVCGRDYKASLEDYQKVSGTPPLLPRAFLGNWWSRYWAYSQPEIRRLVERFQTEQIPLSVFILDMDWHITQTGNKCTGWTGFSWNRELFPNPPGLLSWLHQHGLLTSLNLHPAEGIYPHEDRYAQAARALGQDPMKGMPLRFDIASADFARVYYNEILHPLEVDGVDFWWLDWQQGDRSSLESLDPLWWLNHLHFYDLARSSRKRPVVFSRWGGPGNQRYPIGFSGDTVVSWESLAYQPYFTASAANAAYGWWSHDIGGHMFGREDAELYTRWVQFGVLSPIFRLHCTKNLFVDRAPWAFDAETLRITRQAMQFRHALVPYLYTLARRSEQEGLPPITPLYYDWPEEEAAYTAASQYLFGSQLMAAPVTAPRHADLNLSRQPVWFPPGTWFNFFDGERIEERQWRMCYSALEEIPLFARAGAIVPLQRDVTGNGCANPQELDVVVFPGRDGEFSMYEDDGTTQDYITAGGCVTRFTTRWAGDSLSLHVYSAVGPADSVPHFRSLRILFRGVCTPQPAAATLDGLSIDTPIAYDETTRTVVVGPIPIEITQHVEVKINATGQTLLAPEPTPEARVMRLLKYSRMDTQSKTKILSLLPALFADVTGLSPRGLKLKPAHLTALAETLSGAGSFEIAHPQYGKKVVLFNPGMDPRFISCRGTPLRVDPTGTILDQTDEPVVVDYFGLLQKSYPGVNKRKKTL